MIDLMILYVLLKRDLTMYAISKRMGDYFKPYSVPSFGAIKPALVRLERQGCLTSSKIMSDGGKLSVFYSITKEGEKQLKALLLNPFSSNPLQFLSDARVKLSCAGVLNNDEARELFMDIKSNAMAHKRAAEVILEDSYTPVDYFQKLVLDNTVCEYKNFITLVEGLEKHAGNS